MTAKTGNHDNRHAARRHGVDWQQLQRLTEQSGSNHQTCGDRQQTDDARLLEGTFLLKQLACELQVHATDILERFDVDTEITLPPALTVSLLLDGSLNATLDDTPLCFSADGGACGHIWVHRQSARLRRPIQTGQRVRKVHITVPVATLDRLCEGTEEPALQSLLAAGGVLLRDWRPSRRAIRCAEDILSMSHDQGLLPDLAISIRALEILHDALSQFLQHALPVAETQHMSERDVHRARRARAFIVTHTHEQLTLSRVARETGMSVSTLQRIFRECFGLTVIEFLRIQRLETARQGLLQGGISVNEAAELAGYTCASNFTTAFQREFGYPPSHCLHHGS